MGPNELYKMKIISSLAEYKQTRIHCEDGNDEGDQVGLSNVTEIAIRVYLRVKALTIILLRTQI